MPKRKPSPKHRNIPKDLLGAWQNAEERVKQAHKEAEEIVKEAKSEADSMVGQAEKDAWVEADRIVCRLAIVLSFRTSSRRHIIGLIFRIQTRS